MSVDRNEDADIREERLRRSEALLAEGQRLSHTGTGVWDVVTGDVHWSDEMYRIYGFDPGSITPSAEVFFKLIHPDDRRHTADAFNRVVREKSEYDLIFRIVRFDGTIRDIHSVGHAVVDGTGLVTEVVGTAMDVTEHKQAEDALRASEERFRRYFDLGLIGIAMTSLSRGCLEVNDELCRILGYSREELLKKNWVDLTHPDDVAADLAEFNKVLACEKDSYTLDKRWIRKDGGIVYSMMAAQCVRRADGSVDYFIGLVQDITARKQAEETAREAHERLDMIVNSISDQFVALSKDWRFTYFNDHAARQMRTLGKDPNRMIGNILWDEFPEVPKEHEQNLRRVMSERISITDEVYYPPLAEWFQNHLYPSEDGGMVTFQRTVTEQKRTEQELHQTRTELARVGRVLTMGELTASIAHEVNQPLAAVVTNTHACRRWLSRTPPDLEEAMNALVRIDRDAQRASNVIAGLRRLAMRRETMSQVRMNDVIDEVITLVQGEARSRNVDLQVGRIDQPSVTADRVQLQQVLLNLIVNGMDAMGSVEDRKRELVVTVSTGARELVASVRDSGVGILPRDRDRVFDAFYSTKPDGMGMGLAISRTIVESHGGRLWATPNEGPGETFSFSLPIA